jgi:hypothetical protein
MISDGMSSARPAAAAVEDPDSVVPFRHHVASPIESQWPAERRWQCHVVRCGSSILRRRRPNKDAPLESTMMRLFYFIGEPVSDRHSTSEHAIAGCTDTSVGTHRDVDVPQGQSTVSPPQPHRTQAFDHAPRVPVDEWRRYPIDDGHVQQNVRKGPCSQNELKRKGAD